MAAVITKLHTFNVIRLVMLFLHGCRQLEGQATKRPSGDGKPAGTGSYPLLALLLLMSPQAPPPPVLMGFAGGQASPQWASAHVLTLTDLSLHPGWEESTQSWQGWSLQTASSAQHSL